MGTSYQLHYQFSHQLEKENLFIKMSNLYAIFLFVSSLVLAADAVKHCAGANIVNSGGDDVSCSTTGLEICEYTPSAGDPKYQGKDSCVEEDYVNYPCKLTETPKKCYLRSEDAKPTKETIEGTCETAKQCKEKKKCFTGAISSSAPLKCAENSPFCEYNNPDGNSFTGADKCVEEEFYNYPCKNGTDCFIAAKEKPTQPADIESICKTAKPCKEKKKCFKGDISSPAILKCAENSPFCEYNNPDGNGFKGADKCVEEEFYNYPCKNGTDCFIAAKEKPTQPADIESICKTAKPCKEKKKCFKGDISSPAILKCAENS